MEWIKQNKLFAIALVVSLLAIGGSGYFAYASWQGAQESADALKQQRDKWERLERSTPHPGTLDVDNIALAQEDQVQINTVFERAKEYMTTMPYLGLTNDRAMRGFLENEVYDLTEMALLSGVALPEGYNFSFDGPLAMFNYETNSIPKLQFHVANISMLSRLLYDIKVHSIEAIKRPRIDESDDFSDGIIDAQPNDADFYIRTPYELIFKGFSREFGEVLGNFANARDCVVVKAISVESTDLPVRKKASEEKKKLRRRPRQVMNPYAAMNPYGMGGMMGGAYGAGNPYGGAMGGGGYGAGMRPGDTAAAYGGGMGAAYGSPYGAMGGGYGANPYGMGGGQRSRGVETVETDTTFDEEIEEKPLEIRLYLDLLQLKPEEQPEYVQAVLAAPPKGDAEGIEEDEDEDEDEDDA